MSTPHGWTVEMQKVTTLESSVKRAEQINTLECRLDVPKLKATQSTWSKHATNCGHAALQCQCHLVAVHNQSNAEHMLL